MTTLRNTLTNIQQLPQNFWVVIGATFINQLGMMSLVLLIPYLTIHLQLSLPLASLTLAICTFSLLLSGLLGGPLADRFGPRRIMMSSLLLNGLILFIFSFVSHFLLIVLISSLYGFTLGVYRPASQALLTRLSKPGTYKITFSIFRLAINLGMSLGPAVGGYLATYSFSSIFVINAITSLLGGLILFFGLPKSKEHLVATRMTRFDLGLKYLKKDPALKLFILGMVPIAMVFYQHSSILSLFLHQDLHFSLGFYGLMLSLNTLMIAFLELPLNIATMSWSFRRSLTIGAFIVTLGFSGYLFATTHWAVIICTIIWTIGEMVLMPSASAYIAEIAPPDHRGSYMSIFSTSTNIGFFFGPWLGGLIMHWLTSTGLWISCGVLGICSVLIFSFTQKQLKLTPQLLQANEAS